MKGMGDEYIAYAYWLDNVQGIGKKRKIQWVLKGLAPKEIYDQIEMIPETKITQQEKEKILEAKNRWNVWKQYENMVQKEIYFVPYTLEAYPQRLREISAPPFGIYVKGKLPGEEEKSVAIVGARHCSEYGRKMTTEYARAFAEYGIPVISGMASGIDSVAQRAALEAKGSTYAVLGCGVDICYPRENFALYMEMTQKGGIISEYPPGMRPLPQHFPARNRIISALADTVLIMEAKIKSGSLITAEMALEQGKDIYALPGACTDILSEGCNRLISDGAGILISPKELLETMGIPNVKNVRKQTENEIKLESAEKLVYSCLGLHPKSLEQILDNTKMSLPELLSHLISLEMKGCIKEISKNYYVKIDFEY